MWSSLTGVVDLVYLSKVLNKLKADCEQEGILPGDSLGLDLLSEFPPHWPYPITFLAHLASSMARANSLK